MDISTYYTDPYLKNIDNITPSGAESPIECILIGSLIRAKVILDSDRGGSRFHVVGQTVCYWWFPMSIGSSIMRMKSQL